MISSASVPVFVLVGGIKCFGTVLHVDVGGAVVSSGSELGETERSGFRCWSISTGGGCCLVNAVGMES